MKLVLRYILLALALVAIGLSASQAFADDGIVRVSNEEKVVIAQKMIQAIHKIRSINYIISDSAEDITAYKEIEPSELSDDVIGFENNTNERRAYIQKLVTLRAEISKAILATSFKYQIPLTDTRAYNTYAAQN